ncbi:MAG TPA: ATP-binding protein [Anaerolineales bacterium]|nr:ATP-binding protein [Anaerolineales bacterium]
MDEKTVPISRGPMSKKLLAEAQSIQAGNTLNYRALFDQTGECVFIIGLDLTYIAANQQALQLLGYEEKELVGMPVSKVMSLDEQLTHDSLGEGPNLYERILKRKDGRTVPVEVSTSLVYTADKQPAYIQSIARDISERINAEEMLKKQARILSVISEATARLLQSSNIVYRLPEVLESLGRAMNVFCCAIFEITTFSGRSSIEVQYQWIKKERSDFKIIDAITPHLSSILSETSGHFYGALDKMNSGDLSFGVVPIRNTRRLGSFLGLFDDQQELSWSSSEREAVRTAANLIGSAMQRNDYEEAIQLSEARNRIILSVLPDLLIRVDFNGIILDYSANPEHPLYVHRDMMSGKRLAETWPEEVVQRIMGESQGRGFKSPQVLERFTLPFSRDEYEARLYPIDSREALIVIRDITEQIQLDQMKSDFINRASHELRTPVTSAILMAELIQEGGTAEELDEYWHTLKSELNRQKILIDRLLIAGRLESGMMKLEHTPLDLVHALLDSVQAVKPIAKKRNVVIQLNGTEKPTRVIGDKGGLEQVFINLINNAVKFSPEGKTVHIDLAEHESDVSISIADHGLGIPPEAASHLFERFYRAKNVTVAEIPGSGIGLYIVKSIVEELGGKIAVESVIKQGTTFIVTLKKAK